MHLPRPRLDDATESDKVQKLVNLPRGISPLHQETTNSPQPVAKELQLRSAKRPYITQPWLQVVDYKFNK